MSGFAVRKGHVIRNRERHVLQQTFLCSREGFRHERGLTAEERQRQQKNTTRCGCMAKCRVHIDIISRRWYVTVFEFEHNHELLNGTMCAFLPAYRKMSQGDIDEIERNRTAGIRPYQVYGSMANTSGGFHKVGFVKKDLYNQVGKQRKQLYSDSCGAVKYLRDLGTKDPLKVIENPTKNNYSKLTGLKVIENPIKNNYSTLTGLKVIENPTKNNYSTLTGLKVLKIPTKNNYSNLTGLKVIENPIKNNYSTLTRLKVIENPTKNNYSTLTGLKVLKIPTKNNYSNLTGLKVIENPIKNNYSTLTRLKVIENPTKNNYSTLTGLNYHEIPTNNKYFTLTGLNYLEIPTNNKYFTLTGLKILILKSFSVPLGDIERSDC
jgi:hypothetical protein